jgi:hypothetical protein
LRPWPLRGEKKPIKKQNKYNKDPLFLPIVFLEATLSVHPVQGCVEKNEKLV